MISPKPDKPSKKPLLKKKRTKTALVFLFIPIFLYFGTYTAINVWKSWGLQDDAPRIAMTEGDGWLTDLGLTTASYEQAMLRAGGFLIELEKPETFDAKLISSILDTVDGLLLTGGGDVDPTLYNGDPDKAIEVNIQRDRFELALIQEARRRGLPILGICRGCQILNVAQGGTLKSIREDAVLGARHFGLSGHSVNIEKQTKLFEIFGSEKLDMVESYHGQALDKLGENVIVTAKAPDGIIEAIEIDSSEEWIVAVQWHPELSIDSEQQKLIEAFLKEAVRRRDKKKR